MKNKRVQVLLTSVLMSSFLFACGKSPSITTSDMTTQLVALSVDPCPPGCDCRPKSKLQALTEADMAADTTKAAQVTTKTTPVVSKISTKTTAKTETKTASNDLVSGDTLPEVKIPETDVKAGSGTVTPPVKEKTKAGQLIDKIKNLFKKKS